MNGDNGTGEGYKSVEDAWGILTFKRKGEHSWIPYKRMTHNGIEFMLDHPHKDDYLKALQACGAKLAINQMTDEIMYCGVRLTQAREADIITDLMDYGLTGRQMIIDMIQVAALTNAFHPLYIFLNGLVWDRHDHITDFLSCLHFRCNEEWGRSMVKKWLLGSVAKIFEQAQLFMLVLDGRQGCGKSFLSRWLCPLEEYFVEGAINPGEKDTDMMSISKWIWEVSELQATTRRADREALKSHITRQAVTIRAPYGKYAMTKSVTASYLGTINQDAGFLEDDSGNRRFVICQLDHIDWNYTKIDVKQLWAQVMAIYQEGKRWELTPEEETMRDTMNKNYDAPHPVIELFQKYFEIDSDNTESFTATIDILTTLEDEDIGLSGNQRSNMMKLTAWLKTKGIEATRTRKGGGQARGFYGVKQIVFPGVTPTRKFEDQRDIPF